MSLGGAMEACLLTVIMSDQEGRCRGDQAGLGLPG